MLKKDKLLSSCASTLNHITSLKKGQILNGCTHTLDFVTKYWVVLAVLGSVCGLLFYGIDIGYYFHSIAFQQDQEKNQKQQDVFKENFIQLHNDLGIQFLYVEQFNASRNEFNSVLEMDPLNQTARKGLFECDVFYKANDKSYDPEIMNIQLHAIKNKYPDDPLPYLFLGDFNLNRGLLEGAANNYKKAIEKNKSVAAAYEGMGMVHALRNQHNLALKMFEEAANKSYWNLKYRSNLAHEHYELKEYKQAISWYGATLTLNSKYIEAYCGYSNSYLCIGDLEDARILQEKQMELLEDNSTETLTCNQDPYLYLNNKGDLVALNTFNEKKYYYLYNAALTYYLLENENKTLELVKMANDLQIEKDSESIAKEILDNDIENLQEAQPAFRNKTIEFRTKFE